MKSSFASIALFVACVLADLTINTPTNVVQCQPALLTWSGGVGPYFLSIVPGNQAGAAALQNFPETNTTSITWTCNIASGTSIGLNLRDSSGVVAQSAAFTVNPGTSNDCLNSTSTASATGSSASSSATGTTSGTSTTHASTSTTSTKATSATSASSAAASASATSASSGASANMAQFGAVGVVGAVVAALFL